VICDVPAGLEPMLGAAGCERLRDVMLARTMAVAREFAGDAASEADPAGAIGRLLLVSCDVPRLTAAHLAVAAADLDAGADVSFGSTLDGGSYLVAMREAREDLLPHRPGGPPDQAALAHALATAQKAGLEIGLLRMERRLREPADAAAMLADPLLPAEVRKVLSGPDVDAVRA
jgi:hypothetical protein